MSWRAACLLLLFSSSSQAVKRGDFKTCDQSAFCKRHRAISSNTGYQVDWATIEKTASHFRAKLFNEDTRLQLTITGLTEGRLRVQIDEPEETAIRQRRDNFIHFMYIPTQALDGEPEQLALESIKVDGDHVDIVNGDKLAKAVIHRSPFVIDLLNGNGDLVTQINAGGKLKVDLFTTRKEGVQYPDGFWQERFKSWTDSKPFGSSSVGVDITMVGFRTAYGLPEHADTFSLKSTVGSTDPYRLYNTDVFEYEIGNPMALYVAVPYLLAHRKDATAGVLWLNAAETWVDTQSTESSKGLFRKMWNTVVPDESTPNFTGHFMSESGLVDVFFFSGPTPQKVHKQLALTAGVTPLPPLFSLGYHQNRWNYRDQDDVAKVNAKFDEHDIPMDVMWLDIEHTDGKKYLTWSPIHFKTPKQMIDGVAAKGRKMVTIIDPHIKKDPSYKVYQDAMVMELYIKNADNRTDYEGNCWPGKSKYLDFFKPKTREYWISQFAFDRYEGSTENLYTWNDMNEPSVFSGPEATIERDTIHHGGMENREVHNIYGLQYHSATFEGQLARTGGVDRPFVLSRAGFIGTQRTAAIWTGDNTAEWSHLAISAPMMLSLSVAGIPFAGADIGGFFGNPSEELHARWYSVGAWQPFFRAHSHIDTRRREPWLASEKTMLSIRRSIRERYALLPYWYTIFREHAENGMPPMRPIFYEFPEDEKFFETQDVTIALAWMIGSALLVHPVVTKGATTVSVQLPERDGNKTARWFDYHTGAPQAAGTHTISAPPYESPTPVWQRGGTIIPTWQRIRRSAWLMRADPVTLIVALDANGEAKGTLYMDDAETHAYKEKEQFVEAAMEYRSTSSKSATFTSKPVGKFEAKNWIEKIELRGVRSSPTSVTLTVDEESSQSLAGWKYDKKMQKLTLRKPGVVITRPYSIDLVF